MIQEKMICKHKPNLTFKDFLLNFPFDNKLCSICGKKIVLKLKFIFLDILVIISVPLSWLLLQLSWLGIYRIIIVVIYIPIATIIRYNLHKYGDYKDSHKE